MVKFNTKKFTEKFTIKIIKLLRMIDTPYLALLHAFRRMRLLNGLDKLSIFEEYKEWIVVDYKSDSIYFLRKDPIL